MNDTLNNIKVWPGLIVSVCSSGLLPRMIRASLGRSYSKITGYPAVKCPTHTAMIIEYRGRLCIGESVYPFSKLTSFDEYEKDIESKRRWNLQLFEVAEVSREDQGRASDWWVDNVMGHPYDWPAYGRLALKALFGDICKKASGLEWAHWCTEGVMLAYLRTDNDWANNLNPTPVTVIKRWHDGVLRCVAT